MTWKIREIEIDNPVVLAPMAGVCNAAFRAIVKEMGTGLIYAEMVSDKAVVYQNKKTLICFMLTQQNVHYQCKFLVQIKKHSLRQLNMLMQIAMRYH